VTGKRLSIFTPMFRAARCSFITDRR
jgi:hypothetical protein